MGKREIWRKPVFILLQIVRPERLMAGFDVDQFHFKGIIGILICLALFVVSDYLSGISGLGFIGIFKWFFLALAGVIFLLIVLATISNK
jgi:hypothetical protein